MSKSKRARSIKALSAPAEAQWRWRGERSEPVRLGVHDHHSCSV